MLQQPLSRVGCVLRRWGARARESGEWRLLSRNSDRWRGTPRLVPRGVDASMFHTARPCRALNKYALGGATDETIFALSSPPGRGGVSVIRLSGPDAGAALRMMTKRKLPAARQAAVCSLLHPVTGILLDRGMVLWFPSPRSFTGEDVAELHLHGSTAVVQAVSDALAKIDGLRPAQAGEFSRRALLNGKMDLVEAEGLADLLAAGTETQRKLALRQMGGHTSQLYESWRSKLVRSLAHVEAFIDFGEDEEIHEEVLSSVVEEARGLARELRAFLDDARCGEILRDGLRIVLAGPPNAGKSSLLNAIAKRPAAITSATPGTTRDVLEVRMDLFGLEISVSDTAGLRVAVGDDIEKEGIRRAAEQWSMADVRVLVLDAAAGTKQVQEVKDILSHDTRDGIGESAEEEDGGKSTRKREHCPADADCTLVLLNKSDLLVDTAGERVQISEIAEDVQLWLGNVRVRPLSCETGEGMEEAMQALHAAACNRLKGRDLENSLLITRPRHRRHVEGCCAALDRFCVVGQTPDVAAEELREAVAHLAAVTGRVHVEQVLDVVFADFCVGK